MSRKLPKVLEKPEVIALLAQPATDCPTGLRNRALLEVLYWGSVRVSEARHLKVQDVRIETGELNVIDGKGGRDRNVYLPHNIMPYLREWKHQRPEGARFFNTLKGGELSSRYVQALVERLAVKAGIDRHVTPHMLRHSRATHMLDENYTLPEIQQHLGHVNLSTTAIYLHVNPKALRDKIQGNGGADLTLEEQVARLTLLVEQLTDARNGNNRGS